MKNEEKKVQNLFDDIATPYLDVVKRTNYIGSEWLLKNLEGDIKTDHLRVLDLGCANGINIANLYKLNPTLLATGVDISPKMIEAAKATRLYKALYCQSLDVGLTFSKAKSYDMVIALGCLEFVNNIDFCLSDVSRVCTRGGYFYATFQHFEEKNRYAPRQTRSGDVIHFAYSTTEVLTKLSESNLHVLSLKEMIGYTGGFPCPYIFVVAQKQQ